MSTTEIAKRWGISSRRVVALCCANRISGAIKMNGRWYVPSFAAKPSDRRKKDDALYFLEHQEFATANELRNSIDSNAILPSIEPIYQSETPELLVKDLLTLKYFHDWRVVGGAQGLARPIASLNMMESPDIANWTKKNQFIVTTGYCIRDDVNAQKQLILDLCKANCAGLGLKVMRFFTRIPQHMIDVANQYGMPLIEIPDDYNVSELMNEIMKEMYVKKLEKTELSFSLYRAFVKAAFRENEAAEVAKLLGQLLFSSVTISDTNWSIISSYAHESIDMPISEIMSTEIPLLHHSSHDRFVPMEQELEIKGMRVFRSVFIIGEDETLCGYLTVWTNAPGLSERQLSIVEHAITVTGFMLERNCRKEKRQDSQREAFLMDLISGRIRSKSIAAQRGMTVGINSSGEYSCIAIKIEYNSQYAETLPSNRIEQIRNRINANQIAAFVLQAKDMMAVICSLSGNQRNGQGYANMEQALINILEEEAGKMGDSYAIGVGMPAALALLNRSFSQAREVISLHTPRHAADEECVFRYAEYKNEAILATLSDDKRIELYRDTIQKLADHDREHGSDLLPTLKTFFSMKANLSETARKLYIHRNTLLFRMEKIESLLSMDLKCNDDLLLLQIALRVYPYL